jgi:hypothetical protein
MVPTMDIHKPKCLNKTEVDQVPHVILDCEPESEIVGLCVAVYFLTVDAF